MEDKISLIEKGIKLLQEAFDHFNQIENCDKSDYMCKLTHMLIGIGESINIIYKDSK